MSEALQAISPVDGRYRSQTNELAKYFSEEALIQYRIRVEIEYVVALTEAHLPRLKPLNNSETEKLRSIWNKFSSADAEKVKSIEQTTNHDVKAVEYFIKEKFDELKLEGMKEFVHFALTSQDINNTAFPLSIKEALHDVYLPMLKRVIEKLSSLAGEYKDVAMLSRTHGQAASPTRLGKEIMVFVERLNNQLQLILQIPVNAKFGGATGNFNAHHVAYPQIDWVTFSNAFVSNYLGLERLQYTTQIEHYDNLCAMFDALKRINNILIDLNRDFWSYISLDYFKQKIKANEVGSSAMPHKVNPIDFENSEGNLGFANAIFEHLAAKLPISRLQRDLTDSTVLRNVGVPFAHTLLAFKSLLKGLDKILLNDKAIQFDLENNWAVVAEAIQTILRREQIDSPYEKLKALTRTNEKITQQTISTFIESLDVNDKVKSELKAITPFNYTGI